MFLLMRQFTLLLLDEIALYKFGFREYKSYSQV
jgi:hypothetical protein